MVGDVKRDVDDELFLVRPVELRNGLAEDPGWIGGHSFGAEGLRAETDKGLAGSGLVVERETDGAFELKRSSFAQVDGFAGSGLGLQAVEESVRDVALVGFETLRKGKERCE